MLVPIVRISAVEGGKQHDFVFHDDSLRGWRDSIAYLLTETVILCRKGYEPKKVSIELVDKDKYSADNIENDPVLKGEKP